MMFLGSTLAEGWKLLIQTKDTNSNDYNHLGDMKVARPGEVNGYSQRKC
jgi:hypothetical protein